MNHRCSFRTATASRKHRDLRRHADGVRLDMYLTAIHEAGHAVFSYALGFGCGEIALIAHVDSKGRYGGADGECGPGAAGTRAIDMAFHDGVYGEILLGAAIVALAGMAVERKAMIGLGVAPHVAAGARADIAEAQAVAKLYAAGDRRRTKAACLSRIWRAAQTFADKRALWTAMADIATRLSKGAKLKAPRRGRVKVRHALSGRTAAAVMRKNGVTAGMLSRLSRSYM